MPDSLVQSYYDMVKEDIKIRLAHDEDYAEKKNDGSSQYEFLKKLWEMIVASN